VIKNLSEPPRAPSVLTSEAEGRPLAVSVPEAGRLLGIGRNSAYDAVRSGQIPSLRIGGRIVVPLQALLRLLDGMGAG
jgi:excisionase family DNA binding protein